MLEHIFHEIASVGLVAIIFACGILYNKVAVNTKSITAIDAKVDKLADILMHHFEKRES